jgi:regulatory protein
MARAKRNTPKDPGLFPRDPTPNPVIRAINLVSTRDARVVLDRGRSRRFPLAALDAAGARPGSPWTDELLARVEHESRVLAACEKAASLLRFAPRSESQMRTRLAASGYSPPVVDAAIAKLLAGRLLDDERLARDAVDAASRSRPTGKALIRRRLAQKGVREDVAAQAEASAAGHERANALKAAHAAMSRQDPSLPWPVRLRRIIGAVARRGFDAELADEAARQALGPPPQDPPDASDDPYP